MSVWSIDYVIEGDPSDEAIEELSDLIIEWAEKHGAIVGGSIAPITEDEELQS